MNRVITFLVGAIVCVWLAISSQSPVQAANVISSLKVESTLEKSGAIRIFQEINLADAGSLDWMLFSNLKDLTVSADGVELSQQQVHARSLGTHMRLTSGVSAKRWQIRYQATSNLIRHNNRDQFFLKILDGPGVSIDQIEALFFLNSSVDQETLAGNVYGINGVIGAHAATISSQTVSFGADRAGPSALLTLSATWPKSVLGLNWAQEVRLDLSNLEGLPWLIIGVSLPAAALLVLLILLLIGWRSSRVRVGPERSTPPGNLSPVEVGVLVNKRVRPEELVALLVDLCQRGYLIIVKREGEYFLGSRRAPDDHLQNWERDILEQILPIAGAKITADQVKTLTRQNLFSPRVRDAFSWVYQAITQRQYFTENPHLTRVRYKLIGLGFYFLAVIGIVWAVVVSITPYLLIPLAGTMIIAWLILRLSPGLIRYSQAGLAQRAKWLAFRQYLCKEEPLDPELVRSQTFETYLPLAVALNAAPNWAQRIDRSSTAIIHPTWFVSYQELTASQLSHELVQFTGQISRLLTTLRGPLVN